MGVSRHSERGAAILARDTYDKGAFRHSAFGNDRDRELPQAFIIQFLGLHSSPEVDPAKQGVRDFHYRQTVDR